MDKFGFFKKRETARQRKYLFVLTLESSIDCTDSQILVYIKPGLLESSKVSG